MHGHVSTLLRAFRYGNRLLPALAVVACLVPALARGASPTHPFKGLDWNAVLREDSRITVDKALSARAGAPFFYVGNAAFGIVETDEVVLGDVGTVEEDVAAVPLRRLSPPEITGYLIFTEASPRRYVSVLSGHHVNVVIRDLRLIESHDVDPAPPAGVHAETYTVYTVAANRFTEQWSIALACRPPPAAGQLLYCRFYPFDDNANISRAQFARAFFALRGEAISQDFASARAVTTRQRPVGEVVFYRGARYAYGLSFKSGTFTMRTLDSLMSLE